MTSLSNAHVVVTGGSEGIGLEVARLAAQRGARVSLIARRDEVLEEASASIRASVDVDAAAVATASADVADADTLSLAIDKVSASNGPCEILVCCAGYALPGYFDDLPAHEFARHMDVNYLGTVNAVRATAPTMRARRRGHVLVTSSTAGLIGVYGYSAYSPTKFALRGFAETLRAEYARDNIRVGIIYPPDTKTPGFDRENIHKPRETAAISGTVSPIASVTMARRVISGIERNRFEIFADPTTAAISRFGGVAGPLLRPYMDRVARRATNAN